MNITAAFWEGLKAEQRAINLFFTPVKPSSQCLRVTAEAGKSKPVTPFLIFIYTSSAWIIVPAQIVNCSLLNFQECVVIIILFNVHKFN